MRKPSGRVAPGVEVMESRALPSGALPVLTMHTYNDVVADVRNVMGTLAKTHNFNGAAVSLAGVSSNIPYGRQQLFPTWLGDLGIYSPLVPGSGLLMQRKILLDLNQDILNGVSHGLFLVTGPGAAAFYRPTQGGPGLGAPAVSLDSVTIANNTGLTITVSAFLAGNPQPITRQIANNGSALFDFGSSTNNFITINIQRSDGSQPPPPSLNNILNRPIGGYNGKSFTVSVFAGLFSVSV
jgi:hypothetical protein